MDDVMTADEARGLLVALTVRRCDECDALAPAESIEGDRVFHAGCPRLPRGEVYDSALTPPTATIARALRAVLALHEAAAERERAGNFFRSQVFACAVDATRRTDALALREVLPDVWERLRDAPEPEWPSDATAHVPPHGAVVYRGDRLPPRLAARVEGVEGAAEAVLVVEYRDPDAPGVGREAWDSHIAAKRVAALGDATWCGVAEGTGVILVPGEAAEVAPAQPREGG